ncbi:hypothetical protein DYB35_001704 [Aphanomyces astaci]|uniref:PHD-type domain-containing protein n=3 Tax=Aphanomyces astaci TaxID=112090 RepID=A0A3R7B465_APHAT|nr:hypothetical protein DYB35_001704 [Aphanomyces astaci]
MSSEYSSDDDAPPPPLPTQPSATDLPPSISTGSSLLASLVKAKPAPLSDASESSDDDDDDPRSHAPSEDDDDMDEDELEQLLVKQEQQASLRNAAAADTHAADDDDDNLRKEPKATLSSTVCEVCQEDTSNAKRALVCAQCGVRFHPTCFRQKYAKLIQTNHLKKWFCPDCEPIKKIVVTPKGKGKAAGRRPPSSDPRATPPSRSKPSGSAAAAAASSSTPKATDESYARLVEVALKAGRKFNGLVLEKGEELLTLAQSLKHDVEQHLGPSSTSIKAHHSQHHHSRNDATNDTNSDHISIEISEEASTSSDHLVLLRKLAAGLSQVESLVYTLQYHAVQTEVDLIKDVKYPPNLEQRSLEREAKEMHKAKLKVKTGGGASRLYSSAQIAKLEDWYAKSSRPESSEIHAMYRIINSPAYADADLQPEGIAVKQIRIWFDNRRAKERLDYMRIKMKDVDTSGLDSESVKKMKAGYIDEAKEVLEGRVAKMRETSSGAMDIMEEAEQLIGDTPASPLGPHPLNKDQVTHLKLQLLKLVEDDAAPECVMDILELLLSVELPVPVLLDTRLDRQLRLVAKAHQHNKDVVRLASKLSENDSPDQDTLVQLASTLNEGDPSAPLDYKHVRSWFYKRKAAGHPLPDGHVSDHGVRTYDYFV